MYYDEDFENDPLAWEPDDAELRNLARSGSDRNYCAQSLGQCERYLREESRWAERERLRGQKREEVAKEHRGLWQIQAEIKARMGWTGFKMLEDELRSRVPNLGVEHWEMALVKLKQLYL